MPYNRNFDIIEIIYIYIYEKYLHFNIILVYMKTIYILTLLLR